MPPPTHFPSVLTAVADADQKLSRFIRPAAGVDLETLFAKDEPTQPPAEQMMFRRLQMSRGTIIPAHRHPRKEKYYQMMRSGFRGVITVYYWLNGVWLKKEFTTNRGGELLIPAGMEHCLHCTQDHGSPKPTIFIVTSNSDPTTEWEPRADELLRNEHLTAK